ncbi:MAG: HesA/MoeB/ThiF family protein [Saprospiraceae bacterium]
MRYRRQVILPDFGSKAQKKLTDASVLVIGAGGLGVPVLQYITAAGVGHIGIIDHDVVDLSNLHRQVIYTEVEIGQNKAALAHKKMQALNSDIKIEAIHAKIEPHNAIDIISKYDIIIDCTDNFPTRYLVNDACFFCKKTLVYGAIFRWEGQLSVFNYNNSANYRDLFPNPPHPGEVPNCEEGGVIGVLPGIIGSMMANECIKIISNVGSVLSEKLLMYDAKSSSSLIIKYKKRSDNPISGTRPSIIKLIDYEEFCGLKKYSFHDDTISSAELKTMLNGGEKIQLIDVREKEEFVFQNIGGLNIPISKIKTNTNEIEYDIPVVLICQTGKRSMSVLNFLKKEHDFDNLQSLDGGLKAYLVVSR